MGAASIISLIAELAPTVQNLILHFKHSDGTTTLVALISDAKTQNDLNATQIQAFLDKLGTAPAKTS